ncbi:MAG: hypothetical protein ABSF89_11755 [Acidimicrobiales bacterium]
MTPDKARSRGGSSTRRTTQAIKTSPASTDPYDIAYFKRHQDDDPDESVPGREFMISCPANVRAKLTNVLIAVASAPPPRFAGGGMWEAMHGETTGYHEARVDGPSRTHYRLFCKLDSNAEGRGPLLTILCGASKAFRTEFPESLYDEVRVLGKEYLSRNPRSLA